jgi:maleylpyruvate isomerase
MGKPERDIDGCRVSHQRLEQAIAALTDDQVARPSRLPDWSVGHVLAHIARNADSVTRRLQGAARGEIVDQYPGGLPGRAAEIDAGASRSAAELIADVGTANEALDAAIDAMPDAAWSNTTRNVRGVDQPADRLIFDRWREVEVHHVDLGLGYEPTQWPSALVDAWLPRVLTTLPARTDPAQLLAWALRRGDAPDLSSGG